MFQVSALIISGAILFAALKALQEENPEKQSSSGMIIALVIIAVALVAFAFFVIPELLSS